MFFQTSNCNYTEKREAFGSVTGASVSVQGPRPAASEVAAAFCPQMLLMPQMGQVAPVYAFRDICWVLWSLDESCLKECWQLLIIIITVLWGRRKLALVNTLLWCKKL